MSSFVRRSEDACVEQRSNRKCETEIPQNRHFSSNKLALHLRIQGARDLSFMPSSFPLLLSFTFSSYDSHGDDPPPRSSYLLGSIQKEVPRQTVSDPLALTVDEQGEVRKERWNTDLFDKK